MGNRARNAAPPAAIGVALVVLATLIAALAPAAARAAHDDWPTYHRDNARAGVGSAARIASLARDPAWTARLDGAAYAEPIVARGLLLVATENNSVYAFDLRGHRRWRRHLGTPVDGSTLPCGNIDPSGITSTPALDPNRRTL